MPDMIPGRMPDLPSPEEFNRQLKENMPKKKSPKECKKYVELVASMSVDFLMGRLTIGCYVSNLKLIVNELDGHV